MNRDRPKVVDQITERGSQPKTLHVVQWITSEGKTFEARIFEFHLKVYCDQRAMELFFNASLNPAFITELLITHIASSHENQRTRSIS